MKHHFDAVALIEMRGLNLLRSYFELNNDYGFGRNLQMMQTVSAT